VKNISASSNIYTHKNILRRTWQTSERSGEAKEWVCGVGKNEDPEKEWVELMERVIKRERVWVS
jgi:hypothetical protein